MQLPRLHITVDRSPREESSATHPQTVDVDITIVTVAIVATVALSLSIGPIHSYAYVSACVHDNYRINVYKTGNPSSPTDLQTHDGSALDNRVTLTFDL